MDILVFGKHFLGILGGAERSIFRYVTKRHSKDNVILSGFYDNDTFSLHPHEFSKVNLKFRSLPFFLPILEYFILHKKVVNRLREIEFDRVRVYGFYLPIGYSLKRLGKSVELHVRSETDLGIFNNYQTGWKKVLKTVWLTCNKPLRYLYVYVLHKSFSNCDTIIVNSKFIQAELKSRYSVNSTIVYPELSSIVLSSRRPSKHIVMVGDEKVKGFDTFRSIASLMPSESFLAFSKKISDRKRVSGNLELHPWTDDVSFVFEQAKVILVPSIWLEAYGRVAREAYLLDIPVLVSNVGGLPEAVEYNSRNIITNYKDPVDWVKALNDFL